MNASKDFIQNNLKFNAAIAGFGCHYFCVLPSDCNMSMLLKIASDFMCILCDYIAFYKLICDYIINAVHAARVAVVSNTNHQHTIPPIQREKKLTIVDYKLVRIYVAQINRAR